jgi:predicted Ser/Thr protein kinase
MFTSRFQQFANKLRDPDSSIFARKPRLREASKSTGQKGASPKPVLLDNPTVPGSGGSTVATSCDVLKAVAPIQSNQRTSGPFSGSARLEAASTMSSDHGSSLRLDLKARSCASGQSYANSVLGKLEGFSKMSHVAEGTNGIVYLARRQIEGDLVALKQTKVWSFEKGVALKNEYELLTKLDHRNIVKVVDLAWADSVPVVVMEYIRGKSMHDVSVRVGRGLDDVMQAQVSYELCSAVHYLAQHGIVHRDITPRNVLVTTQSRGRSVVLVDFGSACQPQHSVLVSKIGTAYYSSPEMNCGLEYGPLVDVWGIGATMAAAICGVGFDTLFNIDSISVVDPVALNFSGTGWKVNLREHMQDLVADFLHTACAVSPNQRPTAGTLLQHPFLKDVPKSGPATTGNK